MVKNFTPKQVAIVELQPSKGFYGLTTAFPERATKDLSKKAELIWERSAPISSGSRNPSAPLNPTASQSSSNVAVSQGAPNQHKGNIAKTSTQNNQKTSGILSAFRKSTGESAFLSLDAFREIVDYGRSLYRKGVRFVDWSKRMVRDLGEDVKIHLRRIFDLVSAPQSKPDRANDTSWEEIDDNENPEAPSREELREPKHERPSGRAQGAPSPKVQPYTGVAEGVGR